MMESHKRWLAARIGTSIGVLCVFALAACETPVVSNLNEGDANRALTSLRRAHIPATKSRSKGGTAKQSYTLSVPDHLAADAIGVLNHEGIPRGRQQPAKRSATASLLQSKRERVWNQTRELSRTLSSTLSSLPHVIEARVHIAAQEHPPTLFERALSASAETRAEDRNLPSGTAGHHSVGKAARRAAVLIRLRESSDAGRRASIRSSQVQRLVAGAVEGLAPENVVVISVPQQAPRAQSKRRRQTPWSSIGSSNPLLPWLLLASLAANLALAAFLLLRRRPRHATKS